MTVTDNMYGVTKLLHILLSMYEIMLEMRATQLKPTIGSVNALAGEVPFVEHHRSRFDVSYGRVYKQFPPVI